MDPELEALRRKRLAELQDQQDTAQQRQQEQLQQEINQLESMIKQALTKEAAERYYNIKAVNPELAVQVLVLLSQIVHRNPAASIDDETFRQFLSKAVPKKREFKIIRK